MILAAHDFRCHVARRSTSLARIVRGKDACDAKVSEAKIAFIIKDQILRLYIPVNDSLFVNFLDAQNHLDGNQEARL